MDLSSLLDWNLLIFYLPLSSNDAVGGGGGVCVCGDNVWLKFWLLANGNLVEWSKLLNITVVKLPLALLII
jgi:hypothetical protein